MYSTVTFVVRRDRNGWISVWDLRRTHIAFIYVCNGSQISRSRKATSTQLVWRFMATRIWPYPIASSRAPVKEDLLLPNSYNFWFGWRIYTRRVIYQLTTVQQLLACSWSYPFLSVKKIEPIHSSGFTKAVQRVLHHPVLPRKSVWM